LWRVFDKVPFEKQISADNLTGVGNSYAGAISSNTTILPSKSVE
jgi:hypothetical protein